MYKRACDNFSFFEKITIHPLPQVCPPQPCYQSFSRPFMACRRSVRTAGSTENRQTIKTAWETYFCGEITGTALGPFLWFGYMTLFNIYLLFDIFYAYITSLRSHCISSSVYFVTFIVRVNCLLRLPRLVRYISKTCQRRF